jgi:hypothetical protein
MRAYSQSNKRKLATAALHALLILQPEPSDAEGTAANDAP